MELYLSDRNQLHIFDNDNFLIIPKSIFSDNDNLPISCKNVEISAVDNFFDNIAHPYLEPNKSTKRYNRTCGKEKRSCLILKK